MIIKMQQELVSILLQHRMVKDFGTKFTGRGKHREGAKNSPKKAINIFEAYGDAAIGGTLAEAADPEGLDPKCTRQMTGKTRHLGVFSRQNRVFSRHKQMSSPSGDALHGTKVKAPNEIVLDRLYYDAEKRRKKMDLIRLSKKEKDDSEWEAHRAEQKRRSDVAWKLVKDDAYDAGVDPMRVVYKRQREWLDDVQRPEGF